jgi:hypothetical protein
MTNNNYFTCGREAFFFDDRSIESTQTAFEAAIEYQKANEKYRALRVYRSPVCRGDWDQQASVVEKGAAA